MPTRSNPETAESVSLRRSSASTEGESRVFGFGKDSIPSLLDFRLLFADTFAQRKFAPGWGPGAIEEKSSYAPAHQTATRDPGLPQRVHPAARLRAEPRGDRQEVRSLVAGDRAQAPDESPGQGLHQARVESEPVGRDGADPCRRARRRAAAAWLRRGGPPD